VPSRELTPSCRACQEREVAAHLHRFATSGGGAQSAIRLAFFNSNRNPLAKAKSPKIFSDVGCLKLSVSPCQKSLKPVRAHRGSVDNCFLNIRYADPRGVNLRGLVAVPSSKAKKVSLLQARVLGSWQVGRVIHALWEDSVVVGTISLSLSSSSCPSPCSPSAAVHIFWCCCVLALLPRSFQIASSPRRFSDRGFVTERQERYLLA